jgi:hypothetical protein
MAEGAMDELCIPTNLNQNLRVRETNSDTRLSQSDAHSDRDRQGKKRHKNSGKNDEADSPEEEKAHGLDILA